MVRPPQGDPRRPGEQPANSRMKPPALRAAAYPPRWADNGHESGERLRVGSIGRSVNDAHLQHRS